MMDNIGIKLCNCQRCGELATWELWTRLTYNAVCNNCKDIYITEPESIQLRDKWEWLHHPEGILDSNEIIQIKES